VASLGLIASGDEATVRADLGMAIESAAWLASVQRRDGSVPVSPGPDTPAWSTPHAILLWGGLDGFEAPRRRARDWLLGFQGETLPHHREDRGAIGHDPSLIGWPWVAKTHSWLEPTAMAVLALCREGQGDHPRVRQGVGLVLDRAIPDGGWNYGNTSVFGRTLRPQPGPTGLALLALAARGEGAPAVPAALDYLRATLPALRAAVSVGWGVLALRAYHACPIEADAWLAEAFDRCTGRADAALGLALLLLAAREETLGLLPPLGRTKSIGIRKGRDG